MNEMNQLLQSYRNYISKCQLYTTSEYSNWKYVLSWHEGEMGLFTTFNAKLPGKKMSMFGKTASKKCHQQQHRSNTSLCQTKRSTQCLLPDPSGYATWQYGHWKPPAGVYPAALSPGGIGEIAKSGASGSRMRCACVGKIDRVGKTGRARTEKPDAGLGTEA